MKLIKLISVIFIICILTLGLVSLSFGQDDRQTDPTDEGSSGTVSTSENAAVYFHVGSPLILYNGQISFLDSEDYDVAVTEIDDRTLIPLRSVAEYFGAEVEYDAGNKCAIINYNGKRYSFPIGKNYYTTAEGTETHSVTMDTRALLINNRTMVPLRVICENVLNKIVDYSDGVIAVSDKPVSLGSSDSLINEIKLKIGMAVKADSYEQIKKLFENDPSHNKILYGISPVRAGLAASEAESAVQDQAAGIGSDGSKSSSEGAYSSTNIQVSGIDEADIVKTDGGFIYIAGNNAVRIVKANDGDLQDTGIIKFPDDRTVHEIYVDGDRLVILGTHYEYEKMPGPYPYPVKDLPMTDGGAAEASDLRVSVAPDIGIMPPYYSAKNYSFVEVYDISDPGQPVSVKAHEMEGYYQSSRKSGDIVYLVTNANAGRGIVVPMMKDTIVSKESAPLKSDDIMIMPDYISPGYVVLSAVNITDDSKTQVEAVTASGHILYMSETALYLAAGNYEGNTIITKFSIDGMNIGYGGSGTVEGQLLNQFSMDEYNGNLRIATTSWDNENALYILDESLNVIGSVTGLAEDERIYSVRFMGDKGYIVTFRNIDPLFVFDLSDPENPKVTGDLKIPGFSNYLHPVGEDLLLGIGADTREIYEKDSKGNEVVIGTRQSGIKLSLFDVSDMGKPREITNYVIGENGSYSEAFYNHKAVMVDTTSEIVAFDAYITSGKNWNDIKQGALVISYKNSDLNLKGILDFQHPEVYGKYIPYGRRVIYIGDVLYYVQDGVIQAFDYNSLQKIGSLSLK